MKLLMSLSLGVLLAFALMISMPAVAGKWVNGLYAKKITDVYRVYYNRYTKGGKKGKPVLVQFGVGDFSGDGLPEIVLGGPILDQKTSDQLYTRMKSFVIRRSAKGKFSLYKPMMRVMPYSGNARAAIIADFNGDNRNDLFIVDHGYDAEPFPGDQNVLILSRGKRGFFNAKTRIPKLKDFSHGVGAGDVDGDGDIDLFVAQSRHEGSSHHYFLENRKGKFIRVPNGKWMDKSLSKITVGMTIPGGGIDRLSGAELEDIDGDGQTDLLLVTGKGESLHNTRIVFGKKGKFKAANVVELSPDRFFKKKSITRGYVIGDIDGNGLKDLILLHVADQGGSQQGMSLQVLVQTKKRTFKDKTQRYIPGIKYKKGEWSYALHLADLNNDNRKDLVIQSIGPLKATGEVSPPHVFLQQKNKQFKPVRINNLTGGQDWILMGVQPVDIDGDGQMELVGFKKVEASNPAKNYFTIQVVELTTKKVKTKHLSVNSKIYALSSTRLRVSQALAVLASERVAFFDEYDRDFQIPLASFAPSYSGTLNRWMAVDDSQQQANQEVREGLSFVVDTEQYNPNDSSLSDIPFHLSYQEEEDGFVWHLGQGNATERLETPDSLAFGLMGKGNTLSGAYPVLSIAEGGTYGLIKQPLGQGFSLTSGALSNTRLDSNDKDRGYAPKANALVLSLNRISEDRGLSGHITATYLTEKEGVLGTGGVGGLHFTDGFDSNAITVGTQYRMPDDYSLSASYTKAFSSGDTVSDRVLTLHNSKLSSTAFAVGLEKQEVATDKDHLKFSISQPLRVERGHMTLTHDDYYDEDEVLHSRTVGIDLGSSSRQIDYQLQYTRPLSKNRKLGLFAYYAQDYLHQAHQYDYGLGIKINGSF